MSKLTQKRPGSFEAWMVRPVYLVQCFTYELHWMLACPGRKISLRPRVQYRTPPVSAARNQLSQALRRMRQNGLAVDKVREIALVIINAPDSFSGRNRAECRAEADRLMHQFLDPTGLAIYEEQEYLATAFRK